MAAVAAAAPIITGLLGAGATVYSARQQSKAAKEARQAQQQATLPDRASQSVQRAEKQAFGLNGGNSRFNQQGSILGGILGGMNKTHTGL